MAGLLLPVLHAESLCTFLHPGRYNGFAFCSACSSNLAIFQVHSTSAAPNQEAQPLFVSTLVYPAALHAFAASVSASPVHADLCTMFQLPLPTDHYMIVTIL